MENAFLVRPTGKFPKWTERFDEWITCLAFPHQFQALDDFIYHGQAQDVLCEEMDRTEFSNWTNRNFV